MTGKKTIVLGLDGATWEIIDPLIEKGIMPNLRKLKNKSVVSNLKSTIPPQTAPAWPSIFTGYDPGKHGLLGFNRYDKQYSFHLFTRKDIEKPALWDYLSKENKKVAVIHCPCTYPPKKVNGYMISGLQTPSINSECTSPKKFKEEIFEKVNKNYSIHSKIFTSKNTKKAYNDLVTLTKRKFSILKYFLTEKNTDFIFWVLGGTDKLGHNMTKYWDKSHILYRKTKFKRKFEDYYRLLDKKIGEILVEINKRKYNLIILSDHGMGKSEYRFNFEKWLESEGYLKTKGRSPFNFKKLFKLYKKLPVLHKFERKIRNNLYKKTKVLSTPSLDKQYEMHNTKVFPGRDGFFINSKDKFDKGIVKEENKVNLIREIKNKLKKLRLPNGEEININFYDPTKIYSKNNTRIYEDCIFFLDERRITLTRNSKEIFRKVREDEVSGDHRPNGIFLAHGPDFREGTKIKSNHLYNITPTILHMYGVPILKDMDGRVLKEIFKEGSEPEEREINYKYPRNRKKIKI